MPDVCRQMGVSEATFYIWKKKYADVGVAELRQLWSLEDENARQGIGMCFLARRAGRMSWMGVQVDPGQRRRPGGPPGPESHRG